MRKSLIILPLFFNLLFGCQNRKSTSQSEKDIGSQNIALVKKLLKEGDNKNVDFLETICVSDYRYYFPSNAEPLNLEEHKKLWKGFNEAFPDLKHTIEDIYAMENLVVARLTVRGSLMKEFAGILPKGQKVEVGQIVILRIINSKLTEFWEEADLLGFYKQLGMEPQMIDQ